jgi:hypothetical protein
MMRTVCCKLEFEFYINSPMRQKPANEGGIYYCANCENEFRQDEIKIIVDDDNKELFEPITQ